MPTVNLSELDDAYAVSSSGLVVYANGGNDVVWISRSASTTVYGGDGNDDIQPSKNPGEGNTLIGSHFVDGGAGSDRLALAFLIKNLLQHAHL
jgi:hypothetical protein